MDDDDDLCIEVNQILEVFFLTFKHMSNESQELIIKYLNDIKNNNCDYTLFVTP